MEAARRVSIRVIERPGCDYAAPEHDGESRRCWCQPTVERLDDGFYLVVHRDFEN